MKKQLCSGILIAVLMLTQWSAPLSLYAAETEPGLPQATELSAEEESTEQAGDGEATEMSEEATATSGEELPEVPGEEAIQDAPEEDTAAEQMADETPQTEEEVILTEETVQAKPTGTATLPKNGYYVLQSALSEELVLEAANGATASKTNIQTGTASGARHQVFYIKSLGKGLYTVQNYASGRMLDVKGGKAKSGTNVWQYTANGTDAQKWKIETTDDGYLRFVSALGNVALEVAGGKTAAGTNVQINKTDAKSVAQKWTLLAPTGVAGRELSLTDAKLGTGYYRILVANDETKALAVAGESRKSNANVQLAAAKETAAQYFKVTSLGKGLYTIQSYSSSMALDLQGGKTDNKTNIRQHTVNGTKAQQWRICKDATSGALVIRAAKDIKKVADITGGKISSGTNVQLYTFNATKSQFWKFTKLNLTKKENSKVTPSNGIYTIASAGNAAFVWDIAGGSLADGANLQIYRGNNTHAQKFVLTKNSDGVTYSIASLASGHRVMLIGEDKKGSNLQQENTNAKSTAQQFRFVGTGNADGSVYIQTNKGFVADVSGGKFVNKRNLQLYSKNKTAAQKFLLLPTSANASGFRTENGTTKYYKNNQLLKGWQKISGKEYYFDKSSGAMKKNTVIDGKYLSIGGYVTGRYGKFNATINAQKTLKSYLHNALVPAGRTLYIWGGGWGDEDVCRVGYLPSWQSFYKANAKANYDYTKYRYKYGKGLDCSGYTGWVLYNTIQTRDNKDWTAWQSSEVASKYVSKGWATQTKGKTYKPGDVVSMNGHVWISLGKVSDGGTLLVHSSPKGVQISGTSKGAVALAAKYMKKLNPSWPYEIRNVSGYTATVISKATWKTSGSGSLLSDPDGLQGKSAEEVMKILFKE